MRGRGKRPLEQNDISTNNALSASTMSKNASNQHEYLTFTESNESNASVFSSASEFSTCNESSIFFMNTAPSASITHHESTLHAQTSKIKHANSALSTIKRTKECNNKVTDGRIRYELIASCNKQQEMQCLRNKFYHQQIYN